MIRALAELQVDHQEDPMNAVPRQKLDFSRRDDPQQAEHSGGLLGGRGTAMKASCGTGHENQSRTCREGVPLRPQCWAHPESS